MPGTPNAWHPVGILVGELGGGLVRVMAVRVSLISVYSYFLRHKAIFIKGHIHPVIYAKLNPIHHHPHGDIPAEVRATLGAGRTPLSRRPVLKRT